MNFRKYILLLIFCLFSFSLFAQQETEKQKWISLNGYIKDIQSINSVETIDSITTANLIHNRLNFKFNILPKLTGRLEIRNRIFYGDQIKQIPDFGKNINQYNGFFTLSKLWVNEKMLVAHSEIDRMLVEYANEKWDIKLGRQRINWAINNVWNPNDIFNAYNVLDFDYEERPGNDAVRVQRFFKDNSSLDFAYKPSKNKDETIMALLYKFNKKRYDFQLLSGVYLSDIVVGSGWAGNIKEAGFKGEISYFHPKSNLLDTIGALSFSTMVDRTFKNGWYTSASFLFNSNPSNIFIGNLGIFNVNLSAKSLFPFRYNFNITLIKTITPITSFNFSAIYSPENNTTILLPAFAWNIATNFDIDFTLQSFNAKVSNSFKNIGNTLYIRGRWSF